jgi:hypothetical protein
VRANLPPDVAGDIIHPNDRCLLDGTRVFLELRRVCTL